MASLKERLQKKREDLKRSGPGKFLTVKEGKTRFRVLPVADEMEWAQEVTYFYLGLKDNMGVISPHTFGKKCAVNKAYVDMSASKDTDDREFAKKFKPQRKFFAAVIRYKDEKGTEVDTEIGVKLLLLTAGMYQELIDLWLDEENGDFTDPKNGYDIKIQRTGKGKMDTEYKILVCKPTRLPKEFNKVYDLEAMIKEITPTYDETKAILEEYLKLPPEESKDEEVTPKKKKKKSRDL